MKSSTFRMVESVSPLAPDEYKQVAWANLKQKVGLKLYDILEHEKNPSVVEITEKISLAPKYSDEWLVYNFRDVLEIEISITPVQYRNLEIVTLRDSPDSKKVENENIYQKLKRKFSWLKLP